jgi:hypothetical protein
MFLSASDALANRGGLSQLLMALMLPCPWFQRLWELLSALPLLLPLPPLNLFSVTSSLLN